LQAIALRLGVRAVVEQRAGEGLFAEASLAGQRYRGVS